MKRAFQWARDVSPSQPLTAAVYTVDTGDVNVDTYRRDTRRWMLDASDVISFHNYEPLHGDCPFGGCLTTVASQLNSEGRPVICSEYMARDTGSTFDPILGYLKEQNIWAVNWGFVAGRSQTNYPWTSWQTQFFAEPSPWHHDVLRHNGTPYSEHEAAYIRSETRNMLLQGDTVLFL